MYSQVLEPCPLPRSQRSDSFGAVFENQLREFTQQAIRPETLVPMMFGSAVFSLSRGALLGKLLARPGATFLTRGMGARFAASTGAFLLETPVFVASARGLASLSRIETNSSLTSDLARSALALGLFKVLGSASQVLARRGNLPPQIVGQTTLFTGLLAVQGLEERIGLRPETSRAAGIGEALSSLLNMGVGARLGRSLLGNSFGRFVGELEWRGHGMRPPSIGMEAPLLEPRLAAVSGYGRLEKSPEPAWQSTISQSRGGTATGSKASRQQGMRRLQALIDHELLPEAWRAFPQFKELKSQFTPQEFRLLAAKIGPLFEDPAMNRRAYAFIFLDRLVPGLSPFRRMKQLARIDRGFIDPNPWVRELSTQAFDHNAAFWPRVEVSARVPDLFRLSRDPEPRVQEAAFRGLVRLTEFLAPEDRLPHLRGLARDFAKSGDVDHLKTLPFNRALRSLQPRERSQVVAEFEKSLVEHGQDFHFIPLFGDMIGRLEPKALVGRMKALERLYDHPDSLVRVHAMTAVDNNMDKLPRKEWAGRIWHYEGMLGSPEPRIRERAVTILGGLFSAEPSLLDAARMRRLDRRLIDREPMVRDAALTALARIAKAVSPQERALLLRRLVHYWTTRREGSREATGEAIQKIYSVMRARERQEWLRVLMENRRQRPLPPDLAATFAAPNRPN